MAKKTSPTLSVRLSIDTPDTVTLRSPPTRAPWVPRTMSRMVRVAITLGGGLRPPSEPPPKIRWRRRSRRSNAWSSRTWATPEGDASIPGLNVDQISHPILHLRSPAQERRARDLPIIEGKHVGADDLVRLVTLARDHHDVTGVGIGQCAVDGDLPVGQRGGTVVARGTG